MSIQDVCHPLKGAEVEVGAYATITITSSLYFQARVKTLRCVKAA